MLALPIEHSRATAAAQCCSPAKMCRQPFKIASPLLITSLYKESLLSFSCEHFCMSANLSPSPSRRLAPAALLLLALTLLCTASSASDPGAPMPGVVSLTDATFADVIGTDTAALVEFYAPWCAPSRRMSGEYAALGAALAAGTPAQRRRLAIAKMDGDMTRAVVERLGVEGYPTLLFFPAGPAAAAAGPVEYTGERTADAMRAFLNKRLPGLWLAPPPPPGPGAADLAAVLDTRTPLHAPALDEDVFEARIGGDASVEAFALFYTGGHPGVAEARAAVGDIARIFAREPRVFVGEMSAAAPGAAELFPRFGAGAAPILLHWPVARRRDPPAVFAGPITTEALFEYVRAASRSRRLVSGDVSDTHGLNDDHTMDANDLYAALTVGAGADAVRDAYDRCVRDARGYGGGGDVAYYLKMASRMYAAGSPAVLDEELARVGRGLAAGGSGAHAGARRDSLLTRRNILSAIKTRLLFTPANERRTA